MSKYLGVVDDGCLLCEYVIIDSETDISALQKLKKYLSNRGLEIPDAFIGIINISNLAHL